MATCTDCRSFGIGRFEQGVTLCPKHAMEWRPIETAPKDGKPILTCVAGCVPCVTMWLTIKGESRWSIDPEEFMEEEHFMEHWTGVRYEPTHWIPLPDSPTSPTQRT